MPRRTALIFFVLTVVFGASALNIGFRGAQALSPVFAQTPQWALFKTSRTGFVFRSTGAASPAQIGFVKGGARLGMVSTPAEDGWPASRFISIHPSQNSSVGFTARPTGGAQPGFLFWTGDGNGTPSSAYAPLYAQTPSATADTNQVTTKGYVDSRVASQSRTASVRASTSCVTDQQGHVIATTICPTGSIRTGCSGWQNTFAFWIDGNGNGTQAGLYGSGPSGSNGCEAQGTNRVLAQGTYCVTSYAYCEQ